MNREDGARERAPSGRMKREGGARSEARESVARREAGVYRDGFATFPAVIPAKAGIQYPPGWAGLRKQFPSLGEGRSRRRHGSGRTTWGYWIPVFGCAETGTTGGAWARVGVSSQPLWE